MANRMMSPICSVLTPGTMTGTSVTPIPYRPHCSIARFFTSSIGRRRSFSYTASSTPSNCINTNESPASAKRFTNASSSARRRPLLFNCTYLQPTCFAYATISGRSSRTVGSPLESCKSVFPGSVRSLIHRFTVSKDGSCAPSGSAKQKVQFILHRAVISSRVQQVARLCSAHRPQPAGQFRFSFSPTAGRSPRQSANLRLFLQITLENVPCSGQVFTRYICPSRSSRFAGMRFKQTGQTLYV